MADKQGTFEVGRTSDALSTIVLDGDSGTLKVGCGPTRPMIGQTGHLEMLYRDGQRLFRVGTTAPKLSGNTPVGGQLDLFDDQGESTVNLNGQNCHLRVGGNGKGGSMTLENAAGEPAIRLQGDDGTIRLGGGDKGPDGDLVIYAAKLKDSELPKGTIHLDGGSARARFGGHGTSGELILFRAGANMADERNATVHIDSASGNCWIGGNNVDGDIMLFGAAAVGADMRDATKASIHLDAQRGDIVLRNADCAEDFDIAGQARPGDVMVLSGDGELRCADKPYDRTVVGVISGAGGFKAGIVLDRRSESGGRRLPVALVGKTFCNADASNGPIEVGDLLTTSHTPGHAMAASDRDRAFGAILGKALQPLRAGRQLIPILVALQ